MAFTEAVKSLRTYPHIHDDWRTQWDEEECKPLLAEIEAHNRDDRYCQARDALIPQAEKCANELCLKRDMFWGRVFLAEMDRLWRAKVARATAINEA